MSTLERFWFAYVAAVLAVAAIAPGEGMQGHRPLVFAALHLGIAAVQFGVVFAARRWQPRRTRLLRVLAACVCTPVAFSALAFLLPAVHPEPCEYAWLALDRAVFGLDPTVALQPYCAPLLVEVLQFVYALFYFVPIAAGLLALRCSGTAAFDRAMAILVGCFLISYLGYLLFPTLPPLRVLDHGAELEGVWIAAPLNRLLTAAEANHWDCFPSGHTMLSLCSLIVAWRWARPWLLPLAAIVAPLVAATMFLRYHWSIDIVVGAALAWPCVRLCDALLDADGAPPA